MIKDEDDCKANGLSDCELVLLGESESDSIGF